VLKQALRSFKQQVREAPGHRPYDLYERPRSRPRRICKRNVDRDAARCGYGHTQKAAEMTLVDTGPLVALFDPQDNEHNRCRRVLKEISDGALTTTPVVTEAFHMLGPASIGSDRLREFLVQGGMSVWFLDQVWLVRAFEFLDLHADHPMDLADASAHRGHRIARHTENPHDRSQRFRNVSRTSQASAYYQSRWSAYACRPEAFRSRIITRQCVTRATGSERHRIFAL
jgi:predicted nucleic acid-binding protein